MMGLNLGLGQSISICLTGGAKDSLWADTDTQRNRCPTEWLVTRLIQFSASSAMTGGLPPSFMYIYRALPIKFTHICCMYGLYHAHRHICNDAGTHTYEHIIPMEVHFDQNITGLSRVGCGYSCFSSIIAGVFSPWHCVNTHPNAPDQLSDKLLLLRCSHLPMIS